MKSLFFVCALGCGYSYFLYPLVLKLLRRRVPEEGGVEIRPHISLIITAHNEETRIREKLANTLDINYPRDLIEIIVASDGSTDATDDIVRSYELHGVRLVRANQRLGKEYAQLCAIREAKGDILVFSDVATHIESDALEKLARYFNDPRVGAVSSEDRFISQDGKGVGEGAYVKYEMWLRRLESERAGLVGLSGSFFAARRQVCEEWDIHSPSDFNTALNCARQGFVAITAPDVLGFYKDVKDASAEYRRKVRTVIRGVTAIARHPEVLNPVRMGTFAFQVWSHKLMRWGVPWFMMGLLITSLALVGQHWIYTLAVLAQLAFYGSVALGHAFVGLRGATLVKIPYFFVQVNVAIAHATLAFLSGTRMTTWTPSRR